MAQVMTATRAAGQARLEQFSAKMGRDYAQGGATSIGDRLRIGMCRCYQPISDAGS